MSHFSYHFPRSSRRRRDSCRAWLPVKGERKSARKRKFPAPPCRPSRWPSGCAPSTPGRSTRTPNASSKWKGTPQVGNIFKYLVLTALSFCWENWCPNVPKDKPFQCWSFRCKQSLYTRVGR